MYKINVDRIEELIKESGLKKGYIAKKLDTSITTFRRWLLEETPLPLLKAVELADLLECKVDDFYEKEI
ncbi:hypothetical protein BN988_01581 [Oceanobacillus picturae]|uniref:HTH cro/C1-type domain-containing protein n=1 Tax=Oceanobacillus picturae TaxID=171693 RepID=W9AKA9_9BACI|nr:hypothetical protein [Oceanobacillus picturae]CDO03081.1 hypothetical protein BN988_01581 [Oceanobacillus picturae]